MYKLYIFDKDGTLCQSKTGKTFINHWEDQELISGVERRIKELREAGAKIAIASNQGGVAFGYMTYDDATNIMVHAQQLVSADWVVFCPYHPNGTVKEFKLDTLDRKPDPGMLIETMVVLDFLPDETVYIGDRPEDELAAKNAGIDFIWAKDFFSLV